jgi:tRNA-splicing ligase RtcB
MRADPYQARARALALEAGLDPGAKIDRPGRRPMPTWCTFRDAARKEQVAVEAAAVADALPPQAPAFQNAPLKVFGDHDEGTQAQMRNCMGEAPNDIFNRFASRTNCTTIFRLSCGGARSKFTFILESAALNGTRSIGNVVAGVICADGHLGYAQPVGGVIAYERQISISGVGFDIGCGNMAVRLDTPFAAIADRIGPIIKDLARIISFGVGRTNSADTVRRERASSMRMNQ